MDCEAAKNAWHQSLDEAGPHEALAEHLKSCPDCREYVADMRRILDGLGQLRQETQTIGSKRRDEPLVASRRSRARTLLRLAAAVALVVGLYATTVGLRRATLRISEAPPGPGKIATPAGSAAGAPVGPALGLTLKDESARNLLAVAMQSTEPEVQMYWLYPRLAGAAESTRYSN